MNNELWSKILTFDFDHPLSDYGFSTRLAKENYWTNEFTNQAILEYKKFMYLAATSDFMVSPSEIIDKVWHQHLIFTQSYQDFCNLLGRQIQHIPSTHNKEEFEKFKQAKDRTIKYYERDFGKQPVNIWAYKDMFESLNLEKAKIKLRSFIIVGILIFICMTVPAYFILKPFYIQFDNPNFLLTFLTLTFFTFAGLELYNKSKLKQIILHSDESSFIYNLQPYELIYLKTQNINDIINGTINELLENDTIKLNSGNIIELSNNKSLLNNAQLQVTTILSELGKTNYPNLLIRLAIKPLFLNVPNSMDAFRKYFNKSKKFGYLFYTNFAISCLLILISFTRMMTGMIRGKPVLIITITTIALVIITIFFLLRLTQQIATSTIPDLYKNDILPKRQIENTWQWTYFLFGTAALTTSFLPLVTIVERKSSNSGICGTSCGSSCGSSCSSCGGCGGD